MSGVNFGWNCRHCTGGISTVGHDGASCHRAFHLFVFWGCEIDFALHLLTHCASPAHVWDILNAQFSTNKMTEMGRTMGTCIAAQLTTIFADQLRMQSSVQAETVEIASAKQQIDTFLLLCVWWLSCQLFIQQQWLMFCSVKFWTVLGQLPQESFPQPLG